MIRPHLNRRVTLERKVTSPDGAGGFVSVWEALGTLWAAMEAGAGREVMGTDRVEVEQPVRVTVRAAPTGDPARPAVGQRFREGGRGYRIRSVFEKDRHGHYLICHCNEEGAP